MSAEVLREAAALMRQRAEAASPSPWSATVWGVRGMNRAPVAPFDGLQPDMENRLHIASWHPAVGVSVANLLDIVAEGWVEYDPDAEATEMHFVGAWALNLARDYLGVSA